MLRLKNTANVMWNKCFERNRIWKRKCTHLSLHSLKGYSTPKWTFCHWSLTPMSFQTRKSFVRLRNTIWDILDENWEACACPIDCQTINTVKVHKTSEYSICHQWFNRNVLMRREYFLYAKNPQNKNNDFIQQFGSSTPSSRTPWIRTQLFTSHKEDIHSFSWVLVAMWPSRQWLETN